MSALAAVATRGEASVEATVYDIDALIDAVAAVTAGAEHALLEASHGRGRDAEELQRICNMLNGNKYLLTLASARVRELID